MLNDNEIRHILSTRSCGPLTHSCTDLQRDHVRSVLLPDAQVIHEELQHVKGLFFTHVQQQHSSHEADALAVADLCGTKKRAHDMYQQYHDIHHTTALLTVMHCGERKQDSGMYLCVQQRICFQEVV